MGTMRGRPEELSGHCDRVPAQAILFLDLAVLSFLLLASRGLLIITNDAPYDILVPLVYSKVLLVQCMV